MADHVLAAALRYTRRALDQSTDPSADAHLLDRFVRDRDEAAFAELVARHGPVVWAACRRGAATAADAEDAFQATFLVLARRAGRVRRAAAVSGWLFRVAVRLAARTRARAARSAGPLRPAPDPIPDPAERAAWRDVVAVLDEELAALPDAIRAALVCCYYEGLTQDEAARRLGWKVRTVRARVARGRGVLRARLARRGVELGAVLAAAAVGADVAGKTPPVVPVLPTGPLVDRLPAVAALVREGLALTRATVPLRLAVGAVVVAAAVAGVGYALGKGFAHAPADRPDGSVVAVAPPAAAPAAPADSKPPYDPFSIYQQAVDGCVYIVSETNGGPIEGTGALIDKEKRLVLTTSRVVGDSDVVSVQFPYHDLDGTVETDRKEYARSAAAKLTPRGRVIHRDPARDLALVQLDRLGRDARPLQLAETGFGATVLHIGSGTGKLFRMTLRTVLPVDDRAVTVASAGTVEPVKAPTIALSGTTDDSGGPLVDKDGRLVGIVAGTATGPAGRNVIVAINGAEVRAFLADKDRKVPDPPAVPAPRRSDPPFDPAAWDFGPPAEPFPKGSDAADLYEKCVKSTVFIVTATKGGMAMGSGTLIDAEKRYVLTNYHVVNDHEMVFVQFPVRNKDGSLMTDKKKYIERIPAGQAIKGKVLHIDKTRDLALIQLEKLPPDTKALPLARTSVRVGESVINIGNPPNVGSTFSTTQGTVRGVGIVDMVVGGGDEASRIKTKMVTVTNPINPGDSGGPVIDRRGYQVAVTVSGRAGVQNVTNCIDITEVRAFLNEKKVAIKDLTNEKDEPKPKDGNGTIPPMEDPKPDNPPKKDTPPGGGAGAGPAAPPSPEQEKAAATALARAKLFAGDGESRPTYIAKLKDVIRKYPDTAAAKEAQKVLDQLK